MSFESDFHKVNQHFTAMMEPLETASKEGARAAFHVEARPAPPFARWIGAHVMPPGHIALQGDFGQKPPEYNQ